jgi:hypothetical protein
VVSRIAPAKSDLAIGEGDQAMIGDGHAMSVAAQIVQHIFGTTKGTFQVDHPVLPENSSSESHSNLWTESLNYGTRFWSDLSFIEASLQRVPCFTRILILFTLLKSWNGFPSRTKKFASHSSRCFEVASFLVDLDGGPFRETIGESAFLGHTNMPIYPGALRVPRKPGA